MQRRRSRGGGVRWRAAVVATSVGAFLAFGLTPFPSAPAAHADFDDVVADLVNPADWDGLSFDPSDGDSAVTSALAAGSVDAASLAGGFYPGAGSDSLDELLQKDLYLPLHNAVENWIPTHRIGDFNPLDLLVALLDPMAFAAGACGFFCNGAPGTEADPDGGGGGALFGDDGVGWNSTEAGVAGGGSAEGFGNGGVGGAGGAGAHGGVGGNAGESPNGGDGGTGGDGGAGSAGAIGGLGGTGGELFGDAGATGAGTTPHGAVPLTMVGDRPMVDISVGGGRTLPVTVDTGSAGLTIPIWDVGLQHLGFPTGIGAAVVGGKEFIVFLKIPTTIDFGYGIVTEPTNVDAVFFGFPESFDVGITPAAGILGIGPNAEGPDPFSPVTTALPGDLSQGELIDEPQGLLQFGPNPLPVKATVDGAPYADLSVQINDGPLQPLRTAIDSGGLTGIFPSSIFGKDSLSNPLGSIGSLLGIEGVKPGTQIAIYADDGNTPLYSYVTNGANDPSVVPDRQLSGLAGAANTGNIPFMLDPIYISNTPSGTGQTIFDMLPNRP